MQVEHLETVLGRIYALAWLDPDGRVTRVNDRLTWLPELQAACSVGERCALLGGDAEVIYALHNNNFWRGRHDSLDLTIVAVPKQAGYLLLAQPSLHENEITQECHRLLGRMGRRMAHEIGTRVASVCMAIDVLASRLDGAPEQKALVQSMRSRLVSITALLDEVLYFTRPRRLQFDEAVDPADLVDNLFGDSTAVDWQPPSLSCTVRGDPAALKDMILRLVRNAQEAQPEVLAKPQIRIEHTDRWVRILVRDQGVGLEAGSLAQAFEPFFTTKNCNLGLGLSVAKRTAEAHGGTLLLHPGEAAGTVAEVLLPQAHS